MADPIKHVVVFMLENRSFDQMLGYMKATNPEVHGVDPASPFCNPDWPATNPAICQAPTAARTIADDPKHDLDDVLRQITGPCQGFVSDFAQTFPQSTNAERAEVMGYYPQGFLPALHELAENFTVCDNWFSSLPGPTWPNRFFVHSGTSLGFVDMPDGFWHPHIHIYDQTTIYDRLHEKNIPWKIYYGDMPQTLVMTHMLLYPFNYHQMPDFFSDAQGAEADFPAYSFIEPSYFGAEENDQHPPTDVLKGDALLAQVYNALRGNEALWNTTLLVVLYDEHGGFCDHVNPPPAVAPDNHTDQYSFLQYGVRTPAILVSPWVGQGVVHTLFDHTSVLKYAIDKWGLGGLGNRTANANSFAGALQGTMRAGGATPTTVPVTQFLMAMRAAMAPEGNKLNANQVALLAFSESLEGKMAPLEPHASVARRSVMMASVPVSQGAAAVERVERFLDYRRKGLL